jgi:hypothetical protein
MGQDSDRAGAGKPLIWRVDLAEAAGHSTLTLSHGDASATFAWQRNPRQRGAVLPRWGGHLFAEGGAAGAAFVARIADWLGLELPPTPKTPGVPTGLHYSVEQLDRAQPPERAGWAVYRVSTGASRERSLLLRIDPARELAETLATDSTQPQTLIDALAVALRDGPARAELPERWDVDEPPLVPRVWRLYHGQYLNCVHSEAGVVGSRREAQGSVLFRWSEPGGTSDELATIDGVVSDLAGSVSHRRLAAVVVYPSNPRGLGTGDLAGLVQVDGASGETRKLLASGTVDPFGALAWSPDGRFLAVELAGKRIGIVDVSARRVIEKVPVVGGELLCWNQRGIWVRVRKRDPSGWFEAHLWNPHTNALEAVSPTRSMSPTGVHDVRRESGEIVVTDANGVERVLERPEDGPSAPRPGFPGAWLDESRIILEGDEPIVLNAENLSMRYLLPRGRVREFSLSNGLVIFAPRQGERWCGLIEM